jgi:hypothetical protein
MRKYDNERVLRDIQQLLKRFEAIEKENLVIVFGPIGSMAFYSHWSCDQKNGIHYRERVFFDLMQKLLDTFIEYRRAFNLAPYIHGIIKIELGKVQIGWVNELTADRKIRSLKQVSK